MLVRRFTLSIMCLSLGIATALFAYQAANRTEVPVTMEQVVSVNGVCSGFIAGHNFVVTAQHCIKDLDAKHRIRFFDGVHVYFRVLEIGPDNQTNDYAVLMGDTRGIDPMTLTTREAEEGDRCSHIGHGGGSAQQLLIPCSVAHNNGCYGEDFIVLHSSAIPGDSGSMIVNGAGHVFGILTRTSFPIPIAYGVKIGPVIRIIQEEKGR